MRREISRCVFICLFESGGGLLRFDEPKIGDNR